MIPVILRPSISTEGKADVLSTGSLPAGFKTGLCVLAASLFLGGLTTSLSAHAHAQGILTVTPTRTTSTLAGNGTGSATTLASPSAIAYDASGNLFIADANNHVIREVLKSTGAITVVAGTGIAGFGGDGAAATAGQLDTPTGIAVDASGTLYIADSHNNRIRKVTAGTITTLAGTGTRGFSGDAGAATAAALSLPSAVALDAAGNVYIADTNNQRVRKITGTTITTIAGTGEQGFAGDGAAATSATLDSPTGVAVDASGTVYIADRHNQRIRQITGVTITTLAGSGTPTFAGGFSGEGASSTAATLAKPSGVSVDAAGNVYIADTNNQRIRQLGGGVIATVVGNGQQGFAADGGPSTAAVLNAPRTVAPDAFGNLAVADTLDQRVRSGTLGSLTFTAQAVGLPSTPQAVAVSNTGTAAITVTNVTYTGAFGPFTGTSGSSTGNCGATPFTLAAGASCNQNISYTPTAIGASSGSITFGGNGVVNQTVVLTGTGTPATTITVIASSIVQPVVGQPITFTAQVKPTGSGAPTGSVQFFANGIALGTGVQLSTSGLAALTTSFSTAGTYAITAVYSGDPSFSASTSPALAQTDSDFALALSPSSPGGALQTVTPGQTATYSFTLAPLNGVSFPYPITYSATGQPTGSVVTFTPVSTTPGASAASFTMSIQAPAQHAGSRSFGVFGGSGIVLSLIFLPWAGLRRKRNPLALCGLLLLTVSSLGLAGCGSHGFFTQQQQSYSVTVTAVGAGTNGATVQHSTVVTVIVE